MNHDEIILALIVGKNFELDTSQRFDCPFCNHKNTLSISKNYNGILWFCFHADCQSSGHIFTEPTSSEIIEYVKQQESSAQTEFKIPAYFLIGTNRYTTLFLESYEIKAAYQDKRIEVYFDVKEQRQVFLLYGLTGTCLGAIGRSYTHKPKWKFYKSGEENKVPLIVPKYGTAARPYYKINEEKVGVIVEDAISATKVSSIYNGIAILGTYLSSAYLPYFLLFDRLYIALDADATDKAIKMQKYLNTFRPTKIIQLKDDIKDMSTDAVKGLF